MQSQSQIQDRQISNNIATVSKSHKTIHFRLKYKIQGPSNTNKRVKTPESMK